MRKKINQCQAERDNRGSWLTELAKQLVLSTFIQTSVYKLEGKRFSFSLPCQEIQLTRMKHGFQSHKAHNKRGVIQISYQHITAVHPQSRLWSERTHHSHQPENMKFELFSALQGWGAAFFSILKKKINLNYQHFKSHRGKERQIKIHLCLLG